MSKKISIRKALSRVIIIIASLGILLSIAVNVVLDISEHKQNLHTDLYTMAGIIAHNITVSNILTDEAKINAQLNAYKDLNYIKNIHVYQKQSTNSQVSLLATFNNPGNPPIPSIAHALNTDSYADKTKNSIAVIYPINALNEVAGDTKTTGIIYILGNDKPITDALINRVLIGLLLSLIILISVILITLNLQRRFSRQIEALCAVVDHVSKNKNYDSIVPSSNITELDLLAKSINRLFSRTLSQIKQQKEDAQEIRQLNLNLEAKVNLRTEALKEANQELLTTLEQMHLYQNKIVENEKMASLGQIVAGVAHEVNTPLGMSITGATLLKDNIEALKINFDNKTLTTSQMVKFTNEGLKNIEIICRNLTRAAALISSFKKLAVTQQVHDKRELNLADFINQVVASINDNTKQNTHKIYVTGNKNFTLKSNPLVIQQIIENLVNNSLIHAFDDNQIGNIAISLSRSKDNVTIEYRDDGKGIPKFIRNHIFDPFVTTRRSEGAAGLGLHLVYNLVTQILNGSIKLENSDNTGVYFIVEFPMRNKTQNYHLL